MQEEIKEIIGLNCEEEIEVKYFAKDDSMVDTYMDYSQLLDYINNLQGELETTQELAVKYKQENERYKKIFKAKERFSKIMPENTEFIILSKADYDRQQEDIELNAIELKSRIDKTIEYIEDNGILDLNGYDLLNILTSGGKE